MNPAGSSAVGRGTAGRGAAGRGAAGRGAAARVAVVAVWCLAVAAIGVSVVWGRALQREAPEIFLGAAPLVGRDFRDGWDWRFGWGLVGAAAVAAAVAVGVWRGWWWRARLRVVVVAASVGAGAFAVLLALTDGADGILYGAVHPTEYLANVDIAPPAGELLRTFVDRIDSYSVHVRGHPPGFLLVLVGLDGLGVGGGWTTALLSVAATVALPAGVLVTVWAVAGHGAVRRAAPALVVAPYAIWMVTSADAVFTAVGAWGTAAVALGLRAGGRGAVAAGALAGLGLAALLFLTYGGVTFLLVPLTLVVAAAVRPTLLAPAAGRVDAGRLLGLVGAAVAAAAAVTALIWVAGFWWFDGAAETRRQYWAGTAQFRPGEYFAIANLAAVLIALGPLTLAGLLALRDRRVGVLVAGGAAALVAAHLSQYSRAEVERIWLLFYPWIALAAVGVIRRDRPVPSAAWIAVQAGCAITLQAALVSKW